MNFVIVTGQSGAGKTQAKKVFEDLGYFCIDNLPPTLISSFVSLLEQNSEDIRNVGLFIDIRGGRFFKDFETSLNNLKATGYNTTVLYLEADNDVIVKRFKENRRQHPLMNYIPSGNSQSSNSVNSSLNSLVNQSTGPGSDGSSQNNKEDSAIQRIEQAIEEEKRILLPLRDMADGIIDTSTTTQSQLVKLIRNVLNLSEEGDFTVTILSFGFKKGVPVDADFIFDLRFLPNPFYVEKLRHLTGLDSEVRDYVMDSRLAKEYLNQIKEMLATVIPAIQKEGRQNVVIAFGCTGGQHRSVTFSYFLEKYLKGKYQTHLIHRETWK